MNNRSKFLASPYVLWMAVFTVAPLMLVVFFSVTGESGGFTAENFSALSQYVTVFWRSISLAAVATVICLAIGYPLAYILAREVPGIRNVSMLLIMLPMWINFLLRTYAWMSILEGNGLLNRLLGFFGVPPLQIINTQGAVVLGMVYNYLPFMILPIFTVILKIDNSMLEAAQDLGCNTFSAFRRVIFPLSLPGVLSGVTMVFVPSVSTFIISKLLGGGSTLLLGDLIEMQFLGASYNPNLGSAISLVMMVIVIICMTVMNRFGEGEEEVVML